MPIISGSISKSGKDILSGFKNLSNNKLYLNMDFDKVKKIILIVWRLKADQTYKNWIRK